MRKFVAVIGTSLLFAAFPMITYRAEDYRHTWLVFLIWFLGFTGCGVIGIFSARFVKKLKIAEKLIAWNDRINERADRFVTNRRLFPCLWLFLTVCWIPAYLAWFPGIFGYDTPVQMMWLRGDEELTSHHPLFHTGLLGLFFKVGGLLQNYNAGYAVFTVLQLLVVTGSLASSFVFLKKRRVPIPLLLAGMVWVIVNPILQTLTFNATKDILYGACMLFFMVSFWELAEPLETLKKSSYIKVFLSGLFMCLFRNQGIYIIVALIAICLLLRMKSRWLYGCMAGIVVCYGLFSVFCTNVLQIPRGDRREMLSVPMQQMAAVGYRWLTENSGEISENQLQIMEEIIPVNYILAWDPVSADPVKNGFDTEEFTTHFRRHLTNYVQIGLQNPGVYVETFQNMVAAYWDMNGSEARLLACINTFPELNTWGIEQKSILGFYRGKLMNWGFVDEIPFWNQPAVSIWCMAALAGVAYGRRKKAVFIGSLPAILYFGTVLLGPVALLRYMYPLLLAEPLLVGMLFRSLCEPRQA